MQCYISATGIVRITDILQYIPKSFAFPKKTQNMISNKQLEIELYWLNTPWIQFIFFLWWCNKNTTNQIGHILQRRTAQTRIKFYCYYQCYHRLRKKISNHHKSPTYQHQIQGWNRFCNPRGWKKKSQHLQRLQYISLPHHLSWIISHQLKFYKI